MKLYWEALHEFFKKYKEIFLQVWKVRKELDSKDYLPHEAQFLPAALSLQETPASPLPQIIMRTLMVFGLITLLWAIFGKIDIVATAQGKIVHNDRTKVIQPFDTASVKAILVTDGQAVKAGQTLIELDTTITTADVHRLQNELHVAQLQVARAKEMLKSFDSKQTPQLAEDMVVDKTVWQESQAQLTGQYQEYMTKLAQIDADIAKNEAMLSSIKQQVNQYELTVPLAKERERALKSLLAKHFVSKTEYLAKQQELIEQEASLEVSRSKLKEIEAMLLESQSRRNSFMAEAKRVQLDGLNEGSQNVTRAEEELKKAQQQSNLMTLTSPVDGTVQQLAVHTVGGVVTEAQPLMVIVPKSDTLEVEAFIENKDVGFVNTGQDAEVKITTFQYTKYGTIPAKVTFVSHDAIEDEKRGLIYSIRVKMERATIFVDGKEVNLSPGMEVGVEVKTGKRRVIEYFFAPLIKHAHESLQER